MRRIRRSWRDMRTVTAQPAGPSVLEVLEPRLLLSGTALDPAFGNGGIVRTDLMVSGVDTGTRVALNRDDGGIIVLGRSHTTDLLRFSVVAAYQPNGQLNAGFGDNGIINDLGAVIGHNSAHLQAAAFDASGRILLGGTVGPVNASDLLLVRLNADGSLDTTFGQGQGFVITDIAGGEDASYDIAVDRLGRIVLGGATDAGLNQDLLLARYLPDGTLDTSFDSDGWRTINAVSTFELISSLTIDANDRIVAAGPADDPFRRQQVVAIARLNSDGSLDTTFGGDGAITGTFDGRDVHVGQIAAGADGSVVLAGGLRTTFESDVLVARWLSDGTPDAGFNGNGWIAHNVATNEAATDAVLHADGSLTLVGGEGARQLLVARVDGAGQLDPTFGQGTGRVLFDLGTNTRGAGIAIQADGRIITAGTIGSTHESDLLVSRLSTDGAFDLSFGGQGWARTDTIQTSDERVADSVLQADGKTVVVGTRNTPQFGHQILVARYNGDGTLDTSFGGGDGWTAAFSAFGLVGRSVAIDSAGRIMVVGDVTSGTLRQLLMARLTSDGELDATFGSGGTRTQSLPALNISDMALDSQDRILLVGNQSNFSVGRYLSDGTPDASFGNNGWLATDLGGLDVAGELLLQTDGKIILAGRSDAPGVTSFAALRYNPDATLDATFGTGGTVITTFPGGFASITDIALDPAGGLVLAGSFNPSGQPARIAIARYDDLGVLDTMFGSGGILTAQVGLNATVKSVVVDANGSITVGGDSVREGQQFTDFFVARFDRAGTLDTTFGNGGVLFTDFGLAYGVDRLEEITLDGEGRLLAAGYTHLSSSMRDIALARYDTNAVSVTGSAVLEGNGRKTTTLSFDVVLATPATHTIVVDYATQDGTATAGVDYLLAAGSLIFQPGESRKQVSVTVVRDSLVETDETFLLTLSDPGNAALLVSQATGTILNDDSPKRGGGKGGGGGGGGGGGKPRKNATSTQDLALTAFADEPVGRRQPKSADSSSSSQATIDLLALITLRK